MSTNDYILQDVKTCPFPPATPDWHLALTIRNGLLTLDELKQIPGVTDVAEFDTAILKHSPAAHSQLVESRQFFYLRVAGSRFHAESWSSLNAWLTAQLNTKDTPSKHYLLEATNRLEIQASPEWIYTLCIRVNWVDEQRLANAPGILRVLALTDKAKSVLINRNLHPTWQVYFL